MKKNLFILAGLATAMLMSCTENMTEIPVDESTKMVPLSLTISGDVDTKADTKVTYADGLGIRWDAEKDKSLCLMWSNNDSFFTDEKGCSTGNPSEIVVGEDLSATFTTSIPADTKYLAFHLNGGNGSTPNFTWATSLTQAKAGAVEGLKLYSDVHNLTLAEGKFAVEDTKAKLAGAIIRVFVYSAEGSTDKVKSVKIKTNTPVFGNGYYNFIKDAYSMSIGGKEATVTLTESFDLTNAKDATTSAGVYIPICVKKTETVSNTGIVYEVAMENGDVYKFESTTAVREWKSGYLYDEYLNLDKATTKPEEGGEEPDPEPTEKVIYYHGIENNASAYIKTIENPTVATRVDKNWWLVRTVNGIGPNDEGKTAGIFSKYLKFNYAWDETSGETGWIDFYIPDGDNKIYYDCTSLATANERSVVVTVTFDAETAAADGYVLSDDQTDPIYTITVTQAGAGATEKLEMYYSRWHNNWYTESSASISLKDVAASAGNGRTDSIVCSGMDQNEFGTKLTVESTESWLTAGSWEANSVSYSWTANDTGAERTAYIYVILKEEYRADYDIVRRGEMTWMDEHPYRLLVYPVKQAAE